MPYTTLKTIIEKKISSRLLIVGIILFGLSLFFLFENMVTQKNTAKQAPVAISVASAAPYVSSVYVPSVYISTNTYVPGVYAPNNTYVSQKPLAWGFYTGEKPEQILALEQSLGKSLKLVAVFIHFGNENQFPHYLAPTIRDTGKTMVIFWEYTDYNIASPYQPRFSYDAMLRGDWDAYMKSFAAEAKAYGGPVILIPFSEMNGDWFPWSGTLNGNTPEKEILAYRHVHDIFAGVPNVKFGFAPNNDSVPNTPENSLDKYYPGDAYVDIVGVDGFNFGDPWETFDEMFSSPLAVLAAYNKPIYIFSMASAEGEKKSAWITDAFTKAIPKYPKVEGWIWFNESKEEDWRIDSDPKSFESFKAILQKI
jgi:hypothetical protein